jgi:hypothetical protein
MACPKLRLQIKIEEQELWRDFANTPYDADVKAYLYDQIISEKIEIWWANKVSSLLEHVKDTDVLSLVYSTEVGTVTFQRVTV